MRRIGISKEELCNLYIKERLSSITIGKILGCDFTTVLNRLREFKIPVRTLSESHKGQVPWNRRIDISEERLYDLYIKKGLSSVKIGQIFNCDFATILSRLQEFGIPVRTLKEANKGAGARVIIRRKGLTYEEIYGEGRAYRIKGKLRESHKNPSKELLKKCLKRRTPSSLEVKFQNIVDKHDLPYRYVGNGSFILGHFNPDFINTNSEKIAVEVYARYYKRRNKISIQEWKEKRSEVFKSYGWKLLFFNEVEVSEKNVLGKLGVFDG